MVDGFLPPSLSDDEWADKLAQLRSLGCIPDYPDLVDLCRLAPRLRFAFNAALHPDPETWAAIAAGSKIRFAIGQTPWSRKYPPSADEVEQFLSKKIEESEANREAFLGLANGLSTALRNRMELPECAMQWITACLEQRIEVPKKKSGRHRDVNYLRDRHLIRFFRDMQDLNVLITENEATYRGTSAAHALVEALGAVYSVLDAKTLMNIWSSRSRR